MVSDAQVLITTAPLTPVTGQHMIKIAQMFFSRDINISLVTPIKTIMASDA